MEFHTDERDWRNFVATWRVGNRLGNLRSMRQNFELKNWDAIVPQKTVPRSSTLWKDSRLPERGKKKKTGRKRRENKREGRMQRCSDGRPPRVHERAATTATRRRSQIFLFTQGKVGGGGRGVYGTPL